jgi:hypothetical protein
MFTHCTFLFSFVHFELLYTHTHTHTHFLVGRIAKLVKALDYRPKGTGFDPRLDHNRRSTRATDSFSIRDNTDLLIVDYVP